MARPISEDKSDRHRKLVREGQRLMWPTNGNLPVGPGIGLRFLD